MKSIAVAVIAGDQLTQEGAAARLSAQPDIAVLAGPQWPWASVLLVLTTAVTRDILRQMERACDESPGRRPRVVMVADSMDEQYLERAIRSGLVGLLYRQQRDYDQIIGAVRDAAAGRAEPPQAILRRLTGQVPGACRGAPVRELPAAGLDPREVEVLRLLAEGLSTSEVAAKLDCSERTIKHIVHALVVGRNLRNRTHAVACALRAGVL
jgi:DNA-binding NarL/FixJ family response regulator